MKNYRRNLPPLDALLFFEAAARHNSFTRAAGELYVTQAAVSKRIRELESRLGVELFHRDGRRLSLTDTGRKFQLRVGMAMEYLDDACRLAADTVTQTVRIAANSAVSLFWLPPRLRDFGLGEHSANVSLHTSDNAGDILNPEFDLVIHYGLGDDPGWTSELLFSEQLVPVAAPAYLESMGLDAGAAPDDAAWARCRLLEYERLAPDWINWQLWLERMPDSALADCERLACRNYAQAIGAAIDARGLALGSRGLIEDEIDAGRLLVLGERHWQSGRGYYLAQPSRRVPGDAAAALQQLLIASANRC